MSRKITINEIQAKIDELSNNTVKIVSKTYVNNKTNIDLLCSCGNIFQKNWVTINSKNAMIMCPNCRNEILHQKQRKDIDSIKEFLKNNDVEYISGNYKNKNSILQIRCVCGELFESTWDQIRDGKVRCNKCTRYNAGIKIRKYTIDTVKDKLEKYGFNLLSDEYTFVTDKILCQCNKGHIISTTMSMIEQGKGCKYCNKQEKHDNYIPCIQLNDVSEKHIRTKLKHWRNDILDAYNNTCPITKEKDSDIVVHHLISLNLICFSVFELYNVDTQTFSWKVFSENPLKNEIIKEIIKLHSLDTGIVISKTIHKEFHKQYGYGYNTPEQFNDFLMENYKVSLLSIQKGVNNG